MAEEEAGKLAGALVGEAALAAVPEDQAKVQGEGKALARTRNVGEVSRGGREMVEAIEGEGVADALTIEGRTTGELGSGAED